MTRMLRRLRGARSGSERSAVVVITALMAVVLLGFAAIAIDMTNARQVRRQAQGSADAAALAAAQDLPDPNVVVATVKDYALQNFGTALGDWVGCTDPDALVELPDVANSNTCISIDEPYTRVRVRLPISEVGTTFGRVLGYDGIDVSANAVAEADLTKDDRIIPATVAAAAGSGNLCIENGGNDSDCAERSSGNFGSFDSRRTSIQLPTSNVQPDSLRINYSMGVDHPLAIYGTGYTKVCDVQLKSPCSTTNIASPEEDANHLIPYTGNNVPPLTDGVIENASIPTDQGTPLFCGRLRRPDLTAANLSLTNPNDCEYWDSAPSEAGPAITKLGESLNGRHVSYWMLNCGKGITTGPCGDDVAAEDTPPHDPAFDDRFRDLFYGSNNPTTNSTEPSSSDYWDVGDAKLECFMKSYRFDYSSQQEFFIDPTQPIDAEGKGQPFDLADAEDYLLNICDLDENLGSQIIEEKMASLSDDDDFWPMFANGAVADARFGMIPVVGNWSSGGSQGMPIVRFWGTYMYRLYASSTKLKAIDAWVFEPALIDTRTPTASLQFGYQPDQPVVHLEE